MWASDDTLTCVLRGELVVGTYSVSLSLLNETAVGASAAVSAQCPRGYYGGDGERCSTCPVGAVCPGYGLDPVSTAGHYPQSRSTFVECVPTEACVGGFNFSILATVDSALSCSRSYTGQRCADCAVGAYRRSGTCRQCPDTAWLLFLSFSVVVVACVAAAVYLSKKRINFAGLSIGVVSLRASQCQSVRFA